MPITIQINDQDLTGFTDEAKITLKNDAEKYIEGIIREAGRLEAGHRTQQNNTIEINRIIIEAAINACRNPFKKRKSKKMIFTQIGSMIFLFIAGVVFNVDDFQKNLWFLGGFILLSILGLMCGIASVMMEGE